MSIDDALAYMKRMREDAAFKQQVQALHDADNKDAAWTFVKDHGYEFTFSEFMQAQHMNANTAHMPQDAEPR
ncbi:Nif11-like leader peptide family natural product precursor [Megalodesulfovibrio paquesii]